MNLRTTERERARERLLTRGQRLRQLILPWWTLLADPLVPRRLVVYDTGESALQRLHPHEHLTVCILGNVQAIVWADPVWSTAVNDLVLNIMEYATLEQVQMIESQFTSRELLDFCVARLSTFFEPRVRDAGVMGCACTKERTIRPHTTHTRVDTDLLEKFVL